MYEILEDFKKYCQTPGVYSGKSQSYAYAIQYLCDYLGVQVINDQTVLEFRRLERQLFGYDAEEYNNLLAFLKNRRQSSYLKNGFIKAALGYFYPFWKEYTNSNF